MLPWSIVLAVALTPLVARANPEPIRIDYSAPAGCPAEAEIVADLVERAPITRVEALDARAFALTITREPDGFHGVLSVASADGMLATREVAGATCDEIAAALVLVTALAIEVRAATPSVVTPPAPARQRAKIGWRVALGAGVARYAGMTPSAIIGVPIYLAASRQRQNVRLTFDAAASDEVAMARFRWTAGRLDACPYAWTAGRLEAAPCAGLQLGALSGRGTTVDQATARTRPWIAPEVVGRIALRFGRAAVEVEGMVAAPLIRDRYYIAPAMTIHQVPAIALGLGASLAIDFL